MSQDSRAWIKRQPVIVRFSVWCAVLAMGAVIGMTWATLYKAIAP